MATPADDSVLSVLLQTDVATSDVKNCVDYNERSYATDVQHLPVEQRTLAMNSVQSLNTTPSEKSKAVAQKTGPSQTDHAIAMCCLAFFFVSLTLLYVYPLSS